MSRLFGFVIWAGAALLFVGIPLLHASDKQTEIRQLIQQLRGTNSSDLLSIGKQIHACGPDAIPILIQALNSTDVSMTIGVQYALGKFGNASVRPMCDVLTGNSSDLAKRTVLSALHLSANQTYYPTEAIPHILEAAESTNETLRYEALFALCPLRGRDEVVMPVLLKGVGSSRENFKDMMMIISIVITHVERNETLIPFIGERIIDSDLDTAVGAFFSLGFMVPRSVPVLMDYLESNSSETVIRSIGALAVSGDKSKEALPALNALSHHANKTVRKHAQCGKLSLESDSFGFEKYMECAKELEQ